MSNGAPKDKAPPSSAAADRRKGDTTPGAITYILLRLLDLPLQYTLLTGLGPRIIRSLGGTPIPALPVTSSSGVLGLGPYHTLVLGLSTATAAKHVWWTTSILNYIFPPPLAAAIAAYNTGANALNTLLALWSFTSNNPILTSPLHTSWSSILDPRLSTLPLGLFLFTTGLAIEVTAELQRKHFKSRPENRDRPFAGGLWSVVRNVNYAGYLLWRVGFAVVCAGVPWGCVVAVQQGTDFALRAVPSMDAYCAERYGKLWEEVRVRVPYRLIPGVY